MKKFVCLLVVLIVIIVSLFCACATQAAISDDWILFLSAHDPGYNQNGINGMTAFVGCMNGGLDGVDPYDATVGVPSQSLDCVCVESLQGSTPFSVNLKAPMTGVIGETKVWNFRVYGGSNNVSTAYKMSFWTPNDYVLPAGIRLTLYELLDGEIKTKIWDNVNIPFPQQDAETYVWNSPSFAAGSRPTYNFQLVAESTVPEPSSILSLLTGLSGICLYVRKRM